MKSGYLFSFNPNKHITSKKDAKLLKIIKSQFCEGVEYKILKGCIHIIDCNENESNIRK